MPFRIKAFLTHLALSALAGALVIGLVFGIWHPNPLQKAVGVTQIFFILLGVDLVLGPILTLLVAKQGKKSLKTDLTIIAAVQIAAMLYGVYSIALSRPVRVAFDTARFEVVQANTVQVGENAEARFRNLPWFFPQWVAVRPYGDAAEQERRMKLEMEEGIAPSMQPDLYEDLGRQSERIAAASRPLADLKRLNPPDAVARIMQDYPQAAAWLPLKAPAQDMAVLLDKQGQVLGIVDLRPW